MANWLTTAEVDGLRADFAELLGDTGAVHVDNQPHTLVTITRSNNDGTIDDDTGVMTGETFATIYTGAAYNSPIVFRRDRQEVAGGLAQRIRQYRMLAPWDAGDIFIDDIITFDASLDPNLVGRVMTISDVMYESELAARRLTLTDTTVDGAGNC